MNQASNYCAKCGAPLSSGSRFCNQCGAQVKPAQRAPTPPSAEMDVAPTQFVPSPEPAPPSPPYQPSLIEAPPPRRRSPTFAIIVAVGLAGAALACCLTLGVLWFYPEFLGAATSTPTTTATLASEPATLSPSEPLPTIPPTETLIPTEAPPAAESPQPSISYAGISFSYDPSLAAEVLPETIPANTDLGGAIWDLAPSHSTFKFVGYPLFPEAFHTPQIYVYPANEYAALNESAARTITDLQDFLSRRPAALSPNESIPFLPIWNAAQMLQANIAYLEFQNGRGVRFLTQYGQATYPISSKNLFYTFQGLTHDDRFYIAAVLPASNPVLPDPDSVVMDDHFYNNFDAYIQDIERQLAIQPPSSFTPDLSFLDAMMVSFRVE